MIVNAFSGAGGWEEGARLLGFHEEIVGIEWMPDAAATARAAGHAVVEGSVADPIPAALGAVGFIASPPCQAFSSGGKQLGRHDLPIIYEALEWLWAHRDDDDALRAPLPLRFAEACMDARSILVVEPLRWILALRPEWITLEQVPAVLPLWRWMAERLEELGYRAWCDNLFAEEYGVPQTRKRAILIASRTRVVGCPYETHQGYDARRKGPKKGHAEQSDRLPYVTMAKALGWDEDALVGFARRADDRGAAVEVDGEAYRERDLRPASAPAHHLTSKARLWSVMGNNTIAGGPYATREVNAPSLTVVSRTDLWRWTTERPATTVSGDPRIQPPGHKVNAADLEAGRDHYDGRAGKNAIRVTLSDAAVLQSFPEDYPWQGSRTSAFLQVGNAIPPLLAAHVLAEATGSIAP